MNKYGAIAYDIKNGTEQTKLFNTFEEALMYIDSFKEMVKVLGREKEFEIYHFTADIKQSF